MSEEFPAYTRAEITVDKIVHTIGLGSAVAALAWLFLRLASFGSARQCGAVAVYGAGLLGMLTASALYNFTPAGTWKAMFRRLDHAMIFVMIAGSYTPFALLALPRRVGLPLCIAAWSIAIIGSTAKLTAPLTRERLFMALYLSMGWMILFFLRPLVESLTTGALICLASGGVVYSLGAILHRQSRLRFHNAAWHAFVVAAAGLQFAAVAQILPSS